MNDAQLRRFLRRLPAKVQFALRCESYMLCLRRLLWLHPANPRAGFFMNTEADLNPEDTG